MAPFQLSRKIVTLMNETNLCVGLFPPNINQQVHHRTHRHVLLRQMRAWSRYQTKHLIYHILARSQLGLQSPVKNALSNFQDTKHQLLHFQKP